MVSLNGIHCLNRSNGNHYWCYSNQWYRYIHVHVYLHGQSNQRKVDIYKYLRLNPPGNEVDSRWNIKSQPERSLTYEADFTWKRGGFEAKMRCAFQFVILMEPSISNILYLRSLPLSHYSQYVSLKKVTKQL